MRRRATSSFHFEARIGSSPQPDRQGPLHPQRVERIALYTTHHF